MAKKTITVNVPKNFPSVGSDAAERMAETALRERVTLAPDAVGSGPQVLRLTVEENTADGLLALSGGGSMALTWRRLFSTVAGVRPAPCLAREAPRVVDARPEHRAIVPREPSGAPAELPAAAQLLDVPPWFDVHNPNRLSYWRSLGVNSQLAVIESHRAFAAPDTAAVPVKRSNPSPVLDLGQFLLELLNRLIPFIILGLILYFAGSSKRGGSAGAGSPFPAWVPR